MTRRIRILNDDGLKEFELLLNSWRAGENTAVPEDLLSSAKTTSSLGSDASMPNIKPGISKLELIRELSSVLSTIPGNRVTGNTGLWTWLSVALIDVICPRNKQGGRTPGKNYRYVLSKDYKHYYRHLLAGPYGIYQSHNERGRVLLAGDPDKQGDFIEQVASRQKLVSNSGLIAALDYLYYDDEQSALKKGATNRKKPGTLRRLWELMDQLELTYDVFSMSGSELCSLLPNEFAPWINDTKASDSELAKSSVEVVAKKLSTSRAIK